MRTIILANAYVHLGERYQTLRNACDHWDVSQEPDFFNYQLKETGKFSADIFLDCAFDARHDHAVIYRAQQISAGYDYGYHFESFFASRFKDFGYCRDSISNAPYRSNFSQADGYFDFRGLGQFVTRDIIRSLQADHSFVPSFFACSPTIDESFPAFFGSFSLFEDIAHQYSSLPCSENIFAWPHLQMCICGDSREIVTEDFSGRHGVTLQGFSKAQSCPRSFAENILKLLKSALRVISAHLRFRFYHFNIEPLPFEIVIAAERDWFKTHGPRPPDGQLKRFVSCFQQMKGRVHSPLTV